MVDALVKSKTVAYQLFPLQEARHVRALLGTRFPRPC